MYIASPTDAREIYVGMTRHRLDTVLVVEEERLRAAVRSWDPQATISRAELHERLFSEARRYAEKTNVVDHVEDRAAFVRNGVIPPRGASPTIDVTRAFAAARALRRGLHEIGASMAPGIRYLSRLVPPLARIVPAQLIELARLTRPARATDRSPARRSGPDLSR